MLRVTDLHVVYNEVIHAITDASLSVPAGSVVALLGANGAGKSTLLRAISGTIGFHGGRVTGGKVELDGRAVSGLLPHQVARRGLCQIQEGGGVFRDLTVEDNLRVGGLRLGRAIPPRRLEHVYEAFPVLGKRRQQMAGLLSGGEQQILAMARMSLMEPKVMMLDEPSLGLAPLIVEEVFRILRGFVQQSGTAILLVEQNTQIALELASYAYVVENGRIVLGAAAASLKDDPRVRDLYLGQSGSGARRRYSEVRSYRSGKRWMA